MDFLQAEIEKKRKQLASSAGASDEGPQPKKYFRRGDLEKERERKYLEEQAQLEKEREEKKRKRIEEAAESERKAEEARKQRAQEKYESANPEIFSITEEEVAKRLREKYQPVRLFAESDHERKVRLRALELIEERNERHRNELARILKDMGCDVDLEALKKRATELDARDAAAKAVEKQEQAVEQSMAEEDPMIDLGDIKGNPAKVYRQLHTYFRILVGEWRCAMDERPEDIQRSRQGILAAETQRQSAEFLEPFFTLLKQASLKEDMFPRVAEIAYYAQQREYMKANDAYLKLSIGNAAWPIGVTMVGIHERSARQRLHSPSGAHVLNDEATRKWLQAIKRCLTFAQTKYPPSDPSKLMG
ncbi:Prp18-domain-containing protein [Saitoella complicata NRRL Y-17804]|uniref:Pre-mRNA-splicing factor 18 n=1 Tax=Saitoella complicata (strain BCRC 22490 / CBS 7301 / JCM 7358 / NBRC 10748 / NRRL Y-17804) TaxID=698492 RepID=A0A0E9NL11_SAICN|nr:Prp18-domain-containing protein [Saitoella complicata NRRL Y-17804]ODQ54857.1 Prp18-domain-containing protein [Saitoella complicata NRRL Y-17804]GAO50534.1 hypothetical protein G7K_4658-t1 [Saitoella complicata NRRL Y-17804]